MMAKILGVVAICFLSSCNNNSRLSNQEIIEMTKLCERAGLGVLTFRSEMGDGPIIEVQCNPKERLK